MQKEHGSLLDQKEYAASPSQETTMRRTHVSLAGMSIIFALALAAWEVYFFWYAGALRSMHGSVGLFTPDRLGFNMAWLAAAYLTYQLISIPFSLPAAANRFIGVVDGMASLVPLAVALIVIFGKPHLIETPQRWEAALLIVFITMVDLFGGYTFNIALSRRTMDVASGAPG
jgi:cation transport ATPase